MKTKRRLVNKHPKNGNAAALKRSRQDIPELGESTVRSFKTKYLAALENSRKREDLTPITSIPSKNVASHLTCLVSWILKCSRKATTKMSASEFEVQKQSMHNIPDKLVINWDQTGIKLVPTSNYTVHDKGVEVL